MIRPARMALVVLLATVAGRIWLSDLRVLGAVADPLLLVAVVSGVLVGSERGARVGFVTGVVADLFLHTPLGLSSLAHTLAAYATGRLGETSLRSAWWITTLAAAAGSAFGVVVFALAGATIGLSHLVDGGLVVTAGVVGLLNGVLAVPVGAAVGWATAPPPRIRAGVGGGA